MGRIALAIFGLLATMQALSAAERTRLGYGRLITNDTFGDTYDRWRTGSLAASRVWGRNGPAGCQPGLVICWSCVGVWKL